MHLRICTYAYAEALGSYAYVLTGVGTRDTRWRRGSRRPKAGGRTTSRFDLSTPTGPIPLPHRVHPLGFACHSTCACLWLAEAPRRLPWRGSAGVLPPAFLPPAFLPPSPTLSTLSPLCPPCPLRFDNLSMPLACLLSCQPCLAYSPLPRIHAYAHAHAHMSDTHIRVLETR
jgi:hypothetical protein